MRVLRDECRPRRLTRDLVGHQVATVPAMGWAGMQDTPLLRLADQNLACQQQLRSMALGIVVLAAPNTRVETVQPLMPRVLAALTMLRPGDLVRITA